MTLTVRQGPLWPRVISAILKLSVNVLLPKYLDTREQDPALFMVRLENLFYVDDLKTHTQDENGAKQQLDTITIFKVDIGMQFVKCAFPTSKKGRKMTYFDQFIVDAYFLISQRVQGGSPANCGLAPLARF